MNTKVWWKSKTLWVNALAAALVAVESLTGVLKPHISGQIYFYVAFFLPIVNAVLRVVTSKALTGKSDGTP